MIAELPVRNNASILDYIPIFWIWLTLSFVLFTLIPHAISGGSQHMYETLIWEETFPGCSLNEHNWNRRVGNWQLSSDGQPVVPGWGNREQQYYTPHNLEVSDGTLKIIARQEEAPEQFGIRCPYTSARIDTHGKFSFQYGRVVFRARCSVGNGLWPAVWMLPSPAVHLPRCWSPFRPTAKAPASRAIWAHCIRMCPAALSGHPMCALRYSRAG